MKHDLERDWKRVLDVWGRVKASRPDPRLCIFEDIYEMRKLDRGIDYPLRRLLDSGDFGHRIRVYGSTPSGFGRHPFRWNNRVWLLVGIKTPAENPA